MTSVAPLVVEAVAGRIVVDGADGTPRAASTSSRLALVVHVEDLVLFASLHGAVVDKPMVHYAHNHVASATSAETHSVGPLASHDRRHGVGIRADFAVFTAAFDALVGVLVQVCKVLPEFFVSRVDDVAVPDGSEFGRQFADGGGVEFVLM
jgi:hypothetical protein